MKEPIRQLDDPATSALARRLLEAHRPTEPMSPAARAELDARAAKIAAEPVAAPSGLGGKAAIIGGLAVIAVVVAVLWLRTEDAPPPQRAEPKAQVPPPPAVAPSPPSPPPIETPAVKEAPPKKRAIAQPAPRPPEDSLAEEQRLLEGARRLLESDPEQALAIAAQHEARFARGQLADLREVIAIRALDRLGRSDQLRARIERFFAIHRSSPFARDVRAIADRRQKAGEE